MPVHSLSQSKIKLIRSLHHTKGRKEHKLFIAEGSKLLEEMLSSHTCALLIGTEKWVAPLWEKYQGQIEEVILLPESYSFASISTLQTPRPVLGLLYMPDYTPTLPIESPVFFIDGVQDPGNVGSILRTCNWFGIKEVWATMETADPYAPRTMQSTMGALSYMKVLRSSEAYLWVEEAMRHSSVELLGTFLDGVPLASVCPPQACPYILAVGNEGNGISRQIAQLTTTRITIPPVGEHHCESLNVAAATAVLLAHLQG